MTAGHSSQMPHRYQPMVARDKGAEEAPNEKQMRGFDAFMSELRQLLERAHEGQAVERVRIGSLDSVLPTRPRTTARRDIGSSL